MTVLITGGAGFIGSNYMQHWLKKSPEHLINLDKLSYAANLLTLSTFQNQKTYRFVKGDILDKALIHDMLLQNQVRAIVHFAAESHVDRAIHNPDIFIQTNILGTFSLLESAKMYWDSLNYEAKSKFRLLHISTDEVFGSLGPSESPFTEQHPYAPNSPYAASKAAANHLVRSFYQTYGLPVITINCSNNFGPLQHSEKLIPMCIHNALAGQSIPLYGDGKQIRDWLYVTDHCHAIDAVLNKGQVGEQYNVGGGNEQRNINVVKKICSLLDLKIPLGKGKSYLAQIKHVSDRPGHDVRYAIDTTKINLDLNWQPQETFDSGLEKTVDWYIKHLV